MGDVRSNDDLMKNITESTISNIINDNDDNQKLSKVKKMDTKSELKKVKISHF